MTDLDFSGKTVLVVGGSSGIGNGIAHAFRKRGADVYVWGTRARAEDYAGVAGSELAGLSYAFVDVSDRAAIDAHAPAFAKLDVLVLSQGTAVFNRGEFEPQGWDKVMSVNLHSLMQCANKFRDMLSKTRGSLITISSVSGFWSNRGNPSYAASKAGVVSLTKTLGEAWARDGIRVNGIAPGWVETKLTVVHSQTPKRREAMLSNIPLRRAGTPEEIAGVALFLASPLATYMCGQTIIVDGGLSVVGR